MADGQTKIVEVPGLGNVEFPASMADKDIGAAIQKHLLSDESYQAAHPPSAGHPSLIDNAKPSYAAMGVANAPSGADPHNPGNPNLNAVPESERDSTNSSLATTQGFALGAGPFAEAAATRSLQPLVPLVKSVAGSIAGHYVGREAGQVAAPVLGPKAAKYGGELGSLVGGLYGMSGRKIPTKTDVMNAFDPPPGEYPGAHLPSTEQFYAKRGAERVAAMRQQPDAFTPPNAEFPGAPLPSAETFYEKRGADFSRAMRQQPDAFAPPTSEAAEAARQADPESVALVPEPRTPLPGDRPGAAWSLTRTEGLPQAAQRGQPGALDVMRQIKPTVVLPRSGGFETPNMQALRDSLGITEVHPDPFSPPAPEIPQGNPTPFEPSVTQGWLKPRRQPVLQ